MDLSFRTRLVLCAIHMAPFHNGAISDIAEVYCSVVFKRSVSQHLQFWHLQTELAFVVFHGTSTRIRQPSCYSPAPQVHAADNNFEPKLVIIVSSIHARGLTWLLEMGLIYCLLITKAPFLMVFAQSMIVKDRQTNSLWPHAIRTFCSITKSIEKSKHYIKNLRF
jgi:hypothetical protein